MQIMNATPLLSAGMSPAIYAKKINEADSVVPKLNLVAGALEMKLVMLSIELSGVIDKALEVRMQAQKDRNAQIENLNDLLNALRKLQKSSAPFSADSLDKAYIDFPPGSQFSLESATRIKEKAEAHADAIQDTACRGVQNWGLAYITGSPNFREEYAFLLRTMDIKSIAATPDGKLAYTGINKKSGEKQTIPVKASVTMFRPSWGSDATKAIYADRQFAKAKIEDEYKINMDSGKASLGDLLYGYGVYKKGEALPATKEDLEAACEKISAMVSTINSTQSLKMLDIQKFTNGRNEAYDLAVSVNNSKFESLKSLISMIGEH
jgi:hypothetical protein